MNKQFVKHQRAPEVSSVRIFANNYCSSVAHINSLVAIAKQDFNMTDFVVTDVDTEVVLLSGQQYNLMMAIEFTVKTALIPKDYFEWTRFDDLGWSKHY